MTKSNIHGPLDVIVFQIEGQHYGLPADDAVEVLRSTASSPLPKAPVVVEGVIDLRGTIIPVLDLRSRFRLPPRPPAHGDHLIVARAGERTVAIRVDAAIDLLSIQESELSDACQVSPGVGYVSQIARWSNSLILIHDLATFLSHAESIELDAALGAGVGEARP